MKFRKMMVLALTAAVLGSSIPVFAANAAGISEAEAKKIALEDAGLSEKDVTFDDTESGTEQGIAVYEIEFKSAEKEYDYDVAKEDGEIIEISWEVRNPAKGDKNISEEEAKQIALKDAGLTENDVVYTSVKTDRDHKMMVYDIEFFSDTAEYDYDVAIGTGEIISCTWEKRMGAKAKDNASKASLAELTGEEKAIQVALDHAGLKRNEVTGLKVEKDWEDGHRVYEVEFHKGQYEYNYDIDVNTYEIIEWDKDIDD